MQSWIFLNLVLEDQISVRDQMVSFPQGSVVCDMRVIWLLFQYAPCYLSCSIYLLSNVLWCVQTSNLSTSQSAVCRWSVTKIDEGHSSAKGKGQGGLSVSAPHVPPPIPLTLNPSIHPSVLLTNNDWGLRPFLISMDRWTTVAPRKGDKRWKRNVEAYQILFYFKTGGIQWIVWFTLRHQKVV